MIIDIITFHLNKIDRVLIAIDNLGKEELLICLAEYFETLVIC